jgi:hypothetical protein
MMFKEVHHQTAKKVIRKFSYTYLEGGITAAEIYCQVKNGTNNLLKTGAVMTCEKGKIYLSGYAQDGSDVTSLLA